MFIIITAGIIFLLMSYSLGYFGKWALSYENKEGAKLSWFLEGPSKTIILVNLVLFLILIADMTFVTVKELDARFFFFIVGLILFTPNFYKGANFFLRNLRRQRWISVRVINGPRTH